MEVISANWYQWYTSTYVCYYRYIDLKKADNATFLHFTKYMENICPLSTWIIFVPMQKAPTRLLPKLFPNWNVVLLKLVQDHSNKKEADLLFLPDCHNAHWLRPLHLLPRRCGLQCTRSWGWQLTAVELTILKEWSGFRLHAACGV